MKIENETLYIDEEISDEEVENFISTVAQSDIKKIEVNNPNLGASIIQVLLIQKREKEIILHDEVLEKVFENVIYKNI